MSIQQPPEIFFGKGHKALKSNDSEETSYAEDATVKAIVQTNCKKIVKCLICAYRADNGHIMG